MADILLLEPDAVLAHAFQQAFSHAGHSSRWIVSAQDGIFKVDERLPDIVVVELQLVAHSGIEFLYELRSYPEWQHLPVIVQSSVPPTEFSGSADLLRNLLGVRGYYYKPHTSLAMLLRAISELTGEVAATTHAKPVKLAERPHILTAPAL